MLQQLLHSLLGWFEAEPPSHCKSESLRIDFIIFSSFLDRTRIKESKTPRRLCIQSLVS